MYKTVQYVTFINRASPVDRPIRVLPFGPGYLYNQRCYGYVVATYITGTFLVILEGIKINEQLSVRHN